MKIAPIFTNIFYKYITLYIRLLPKLTQANPISPLVVPVRRSYH